MRISDWSSDVCSFDLFSLRHPDRLHDGVADLVLAVGIDEQGVLQLKRGAREARQDEDARIVGILGGDIFLGDEVHAVAQRRDQRDLGGEVETRQLRPAVALVDVADRSEEHTSELQSLMRISYAVFCLKKKKNTSH